MKRTLKALAICVITAISEFLILWLVVLIAIYYGHDKYYPLHTHPLVVGVTFLADIPLFILIFYLMFRQKNTNTT